jgi:hypothetical protein
MVYKTLKGKITSARKTVSDVRKERLRILADINEHRWNKYKKRKSIFGLKRGREYPKDSFDLPSRDQFKIAEENAKYAWGSALWESIYSGSVENLRSDTRLSSWSPSAVDLPSFEYLTMYIGEDDFETENKKLKIKTFSGKKLVEVELDEKLPREVSHFRIHLESEENIEVVYTYQEEDTSGTDVENSMNNLKKRMDMERQTARATIAAAGGLKVVQIESPKGESKIVEMFEKLSLDYKKVSDKHGVDVFLVSGLERGVEIINRYLSNEDTSIQEYIKMFEYPPELTVFISDEKDKYDSELFDRYSSEEFVAYLIDDSEIQDGLSQFYVLSPYRPPPGKKHVKYAIQLGKQIDSAIEMYCSSDESINKADVVSALNTEHFIQADAPMKPVFDSDFWPVKIEEPGELAPR